MFLGSGIMKNAVLNSKTGVLDFTSAGTVFEVALIDSKRKRSIISSDMFNAYTVEGNTYIF